MRLADGMLQVDPLDLAVSQGRVQLTPRLRLAPGPMQLEVDPGRVAEKIRIDPDMCAHGLQYIAPILAGVATAEGTFSVELDGCRIPLDDPARGDLGGRFTVHSVEVGVGPLVRELAVLLQRATPAKLTKESVIQFRMVNGRVYHQGLELVFPDLTIRTHGSVGLDQSLSMVAEMPIPPKWLAANNTINEALRGETVQLPIHGTLTRPRIDQRKLAEYNQKFLQKATGRVIEKELNRQLERLFGPR